MKHYWRAFEHGWPRAVAGIALLLLGLLLLVATERNVVSQRDVGQRHGGQFIDLGADARPDSGLYGYMARVSGTPVVVEAPRDVDFNVQANTPVLTRHVEMFQWREVRVGGTVHYEMDWAARPVDSSRFRQPATHSNPSVFPIQGKQFDAGSVRLGGFKLSPALLRALPGTELLPPQAKALPANLAVSFGEYKDYLVTSEHPGSPRVGDVRVSWQGVPLQLVTIVARVDGDRLVAATGAADGNGYSVSVGDVPLLDAYPDLPQPPTAVLVKRALAVLLAMLGMLLLLPEHGERRDVWLAFALGALLAGVVASALWLTTGTSVLAAWLGVTALGLAGVFWRQRRWRS
ncbi:MAG: TMEM43 family protein [Rhodanobacter sp.]